MPGPYYATVGSGATVSGAFALESPHRALVVQVPSLNAGASVRLQFTATSGTAPFNDHFREDGSGTLHVVASGTGPSIGLVPNVPTPWGRVTIGAAQNDARTFTLYQRIYR